MSFATLAGYPILSGSVTLPRQGVWHADLVIDADAAPSGPAALGLGAALTLQGTVQRSGIFAGEVRVRVVGGKGLLQTELSPQWYVGAPVSVPLRDLVEGAGEVLSSTCDTGVLGTVLEPGWARLSGEAGVALGQLLEGLGATWRVLPDGSVWVGPETWPAASGMADLVVLDDDGSDALMVATTEAPTLLPGQTLQGRRVSAVEYSVEPSSVRLSVVFEVRAAPAIGDRAKAAFFALLERVVGRRTRYLGTRAATVVLQHGDGTLDVKFDDTGYPPLTNIPIWTGAPDDTLTVEQGTRVAVSWLGGDPRSPVALLWLGTGAKTRTVKASDKATIDAPTIVLGSGGLPAARQSDMAQSTSGPASTTPVILTIGATPVPVATPSGPGTITPGTTIVGTLQLLAPLFSQIVTGNPNVQE
jgi:hypothetical protein